MTTSSGAIRAGRAFVEITGDDQKLQRTLKRSQARLQSWGTIAVATGAAVGAAMLAAAKKFADVGDQLDKMSGRTGVGVQALSELKFAAEQTGADVQTLEKGFAGLSRTLFDARRGSAEAVDALAAIGLTFQELDGLSPEEQFNRVADGIAGLSDESTRGAVAQKLFGRAGRQLLPLLKSGADGIAALRQEAEALGITMSAEDAKSAADLTDALNRLWSVVRMGTVLIGGTLAPMVTELANTTTAYVTVIGTWIKEHQQAVLFAAKLAVGLVAVGSAMIAGAAAIKVVLIAMAAYRAAIKAATAAQIILQAFSGPSGWLALAAGATIAAGAVMAVSSEFDELGKAAQDAQAKAEQALKAAGVDKDKNPPGGPGAADGGVPEQKSGREALTSKIFSDVARLRQRIAELREVGAEAFAGIPLLIQRETSASLDAIGKTIREFEAETVPPAKKLRGTLSALVRLQNTSTGANAERAGKFADFIREQIAETSGLAAELQRVNDELAVLGGASSNDRKISGLLAAGALPEQVQQLQQALERLDQAKASNELQTMVQALQTELSVLQGDLTETDVALQEFAQSGVPDHMIESYRQLTAEIDATKVAQQEAADAAREVERIRERTRTPGERFAAEFEELKKLREGGLLDPETFERATRDLLEDRAAALTKAGDVADKRASSVTGTFNARGAVGITARGPERQIADNTKKLVNIAKQQLDEIKQQEPALFQ